MKEGLAFIICPLCKKESLGWRALAVHVFYEHFPRSHWISSENHYNCPCGAKCRKLGNLQDHLVKFHHQGKLMDHLVLIETARLFGEPR